MKKAFDSLGRRLRTADRLTALMLATSLLLVVVAGLGAWYVGRSQAVSEANLSSNVQSVRAAVELELHIQELRHQTERYLWVRDESLPPPGTAEMTSKRGRRDQIEHWLARTTAASHTEEEKVYLEQVRAGLDEFFDQVGNLGPELPLEEKVERARSAEALLEEEVLAPARAYLLIDEALLEASRQEAATQSGRLALALLSLGVLGATRRRSPGSVSRAPSASRCSSFGSRCRTLPEN